MWVRRLPPRSRPWPLPTGREAALGLQRLAMPKRCRASRAQSLPSRAGGNPAACGWTREGREGRGTAQGAEGGEGEEGSEGGESEDRGEREEGTSRLGRKGRPNLIVLVRFEVSGWSLLCRCWWERRYTHTDTPLRRQ